MKVVRDPIHNYITFSDDERKLIDSPWFQRLRHCLQNGPTRLVYPSLLGTRFEHSIGVMDIASRMLDSILNRQKYRKCDTTVNDFRTICKRDLKLFLGRSSKDSIADVRRILRMTALCHDLGHFPLSHTLESAFEREFMQLDLLDQRPIPPHWPQRACHELVSVELVRQILESDNPLFPKWVGRAVILVMLAPSGLSARYNRKNLPCSQTMFHTLNGIIMGDYDADRMDYLQRDGYLSGSGFGRVDAERFIDAMMLSSVDKRFTTLPSSKALSTIESCLIERYKLFKWVYLHHKTVFFDVLCCEMGQTLFRKKEIIKKLFIRYEDSVPDSQSYHNSLLQALASPNKTIPPLLLFHGRQLGLKNGYYRLNGQFFIRNSDSYFFDDVWFCQKARTGKNFGSHTKLYKDALIDRRHCGLTLWKDWSQFLSFVDKCIDAANASEELRKKIETAEFKSKMSDRLLASWNLMRTGAFPTDVLSKTATYAKTELKKKGFESLRPFFHILNWNFFGDLTSKQIVDRTGRPSFLMEHSTLLKELSNLRGEIPFYAFVVGNPEVVAKVKADSRKISQLLTIIAESFIKAVVWSWPDSEPLRVAWMNPHI